ncbi:PepSY domain-containing protein [Corynebacterium sp. A21]|uniref:PepSY domain-containing protein n=1 Tax=Corynebacterium sp. A21 TaxID=3457318 RepID=UPI003FCF018C
MTSRSARTVGIVLSVALALTACAGAEDTSAPETVTQTVTTDTSAAASSEATTSQAATSEETADRPTGDDPVFGVIDAVLAEYADGIIRSVDRAYNRDAYDIDIVVDGHLIEVKVGVDGTIQEEERDNDDDDIRGTQDATVTAADAIRDALTQHPDGVLDEAQLDEDDGLLSWEVDLDNAEHRDLAELNLPAS